MAINLTLDLSASYIKQAVKSDTYITGQIDKSADMVKNAALAFNEQAGDEEYHNYKLFRTLKGALAKFEAQLAEYVETSDSTATITDNLTGVSQDTFRITATVGSRTSRAFENTLAYLATEYIINTMLYYWWQPIKPSLAKDYLGFASDNILDVKRCLAKSAPTGGTASYPDIHGSVTVPPVTLTYSDYRNVAVNGTGQQENLDEDGFLIDASVIKNNMQSNSSIKFSASAELYYVNRTYSLYNEMDSVTANTTYNSESHVVDGIDHIPNGDWLFIVPTATTAPDSITITIITPTT